MDDSRAPLLGQNLYELDVAQATEVLATFLDVERSEFATLTIASIKLDYSQQSVGQVLRHIALTKCKDDQLPETALNLWYMRMGYYFGEALCRAFSHLTWGVGRADTAFEKHPVVTGFRSSVEAAAIMICKNVTLAVAIDDAPATRIDDMVDYWFGEAQI
jgi:hypothetical protein